MYLLFYLLGIIQQCRMGLSLKMMLARMCLLYRFSKHKGILLNCIWILCREEGPLHRDTISLPKDVTWHVYKRVGVVEGTLDFRCVMRTKDLWELKHLRIFVLSSLYHLSLQVID